MMAIVENSLKDTRLTQETYQLQCFPLYSVLLALGNPRVDYLTLDIEGAEIPVLKSVPLDKVTVTRKTS